MKYQFIIVLLMVIGVVACSSENVIEIRVANSIDQQRVDEPLSISIEKLKEMDANFNEDNFSLFAGNQELPYQIQEEVNGEKYIYTVLNIDAGEKKNISIRYSSGKSSKEFPARTFAELAMKDGNVYYDKKFHGDHFVNITELMVPQIHTDHDALFKYEGPGWESELVGYRFYLDWRNATDIFGKKKPGLVLHTVGVTDTVAKDDSYHEMQDWGMDIFKVGNTLGIGSPGMLYDSKVFRVEERDSVFCKISNGPVMSTIETEYYGWKVGDKKYDLNSRLSITAGSRFTKNELTVKGGAENLVTGLAKYEGCSFNKSENANGWNYISLYGKQTLADDKLGIAILYSTDELKEITEDEINYVVVLTPDAGKASYYFCAAWEQEPDGIKSEKEFLSYLNETVSRLNNKLVIEE